MLCNDPPERAVLGRSSGVQEVHLLLPDAPPLPMAEAVLTSLTDLLEELRCIVSMARRSSPVARYADAGVGGLSARTHELHLSVLFDP